VTYTRSQALPWKDV